MKYLGIDYGQRRVGFAISDPAGIIAMPREVREIKRDQNLLDIICAVIEEAEADAVVLGLPVNMNGNPGPMAEAVEKLAAELRNKTGLEVVTWDERLSTAQSERVLLEADMSRSRRKQVIDKMAAQVILQGFLDSL